MESNPQPSHVTAEMWWFIEQLERLEPETVFAGAWGDWKPGYHCDAYNLWWHKEDGVYVWRDDYSIELADDQVLNTDLQHFGAALDWTFPSAQRGDYRNIRKYTDRIRAAHKAHDPRLKGWREFLGNSSDGDSAADGYDFTNWTQRSPDDSHDWHGHFSALRKFLRQLVIYQAMLSVLRGETLAQWQAKVTGQGGANVKLFKSGGDYWISRNDGEARETVSGLPDPGGMYSLFVDAYPGCAYPDVDENKWPKTDLGLQRGWTEEHLDGVFGVEIPFGTFRQHSGGGGGAGLSEAEVRGIAEAEANKAVAGTKLVPPGV